MPESAGHLEEVNGIFEQPWWLDIVAPGRWGAVESEQGGKLVGRLPYVVQKRLGLTQLVMPPLTQTLGPWFRPSGDDPRKDQGRRQDILETLIRGLPRFDAFSQRMHPSMTDWLPFHWEGFQQTTRYTYVLEGLGDPEALERGFRSGARQSLKKGRGLFEVRPAPPQDVLLDLVASTFKRQGLEQPYDRDLVQRLQAEVRARGVGQTLGAVDAAGHFQAALFLAWDSQRAYYLMGGSSDEGRSKGAMHLLLWEAFRTAASKSPRFDFEGSMIRGVEEFFRSFGAVQVPYSHIRKSGRASRLLAFGRALSRRLPFRGPFRRG